MLSLTACSFTAWDPPPLAGPLPNDITVEFGKLKRRMADVRVGIASYLRLDY